MKANLEDSLEELQSAGVIDKTTADRIDQYYKSRQTDPSSRQLIVFGILGSVLVGLGIILIIAHNWDNLSRPVKAGFAFVPLIIGQALCLFTLLRRRDNEAWREGSAVFLFFAIGACIALISQIYNLPGDMGSFLLTWTVLSFPLIYLLRSSATSILFLSGITWYACQVGYWDYTSEIPYLYWVMLLLALPHYLLLIKNKPLGNFTIVHHWIVPGSVIIALGTFSVMAEELMLVAYMALFSLIFLLGKLYIKSRKEYNTYEIIGSAGILILLLVFSFQENWRDLVRIQHPFSEIILSPEFWLSALLSIAATALLIKGLIKEKLTDKNITGFAYFLFILAFVTSLGSPLYGMVLTNLFLFFMGLLLVHRGSVAGHLGILNYGLIIITALIICRFFDVKISFVIRGLLFLGVGAAFFLLNYRLIQKKKLS